MKQQHFYSTLKTLKQRVALATVTTKLSVPFFNDTFQQKKKYFLFHFTYKIGKIYNFYHIQSIVNHNIQEKQGKDW